MRTMSRPARPSAGVVRLLDRAGLIVTLLLPPSLVVGFGAAEAAMAVLGALFLGRCAATHDWSWLRAGWVLIGLAWWAWLLAGSAAAGIDAAMQAVDVARSLLLVAALEHWTLRDAAVRVWLARLLRWAALYFALRSLLQFATAEFPEPQAGPALSLLLFPALLPVVGRWMGMPGWGPGAGTLLALAATGTMVATAQPAAMLLTFLGLFITALLLPRLRSAVLFSLIAAGLSLGTLPIASPPALHRLTPEFLELMQRLSAAGYWQAAVQAMTPTQSGIPGFLLSAALVLAWLRCLGRGLWHAPDPLRVGLFVAALTQVWPIYSIGTFGATPLAGWFFTLLGLGLAEARAYMTTKSPSRNSHA